MLAREGQEDDVLDALPAVAGRLLRHVLLAVHPADIIDPAANPRSRMPPKSALGTWRADAHEFGIGDTSMAVWRRPGLTFDSRRSSGLHDHSQWGRAIWPCKPKPAGRQHLPMAGTVNSAARSEPVLQRWAPASDVPDERSGSSVLSASCKAINSMGDHHASRRKRHFARAAEQGQDRRAPRFSKQRPRTSTTRLS